MHLKWYLSYLQRASIWPYDPLSPFDKSFFVSDQATYLDNIACHVVIKYFHSLIDSNSSCQEFDHVASLEDDIWVKGFPRCSNWHRSMNEIQCACYSLASELSAPRRNDMYEGSISSQCQNKPMLWLRGRKAVFPDAKSSSAGIAHKPVIYNAELHSCDMRAWKSRSAKATLRMSSA